MAGRVRGRRTKAGLVAVCAAVLGMGLGACTPEEEPTPTETTYRVTEEPSTETVTPTPTPTETPTLTPEEVNIEAAKQTVVEYSAAVDAVGAASFVGWQEALVKYWGTTELIDYWGVTFHQAQSDGLRTTGASLIEGIEASEYAVDPVNSKVGVTVGYCEDSSPVTISYANGATLEKTGPARSWWSTRLELQENGSWAFTSMDVDGAREC